MECNSRRNSHPFKEHSPLTIPPPQTLDLGNRVIPLLCLQNSQITLHQMFSPRCRTRSAMQAGPYNNSSSSNNNNNSYSLRITFQILDLALKIPCRPTPSCQQRLRPLANNSSNTSSSSIRDNSRHSFVLRPNHPTASSRMRFSTVLVTTTCPRIQDPSTNLHSPCPGQPLGP